MQKLIWVVMIAAATSTAALALGSRMSPAPEIDSSTAVAAIGLLFGTALVIRGRRKK